jgi:hypothetical protein
MPPYQTIAYIIFTGANCAWSVAVSVSLPFTDTLTPHSLILTLSYLIPPLDERYPWIHIYANILLYKSERKTDRLSSGE